MHFREVLWVESHDQYYDGYYRTVKERGNIKA